MASFEIECSSCDGHIRALSKAVQVASKISKEALLEFTPDKMRLCARTDITLVKFVFNRDFFSSYRCDHRHRCYISLKALLMPFKSSVLMSDKDHNLRSRIKIRCTVEDEVNNQIVFRIGADPPAATLTYKLSINDLDPSRMAELNAINRTIEYARVEIAPVENKRDRFLLSAFNSFAPDIDQVSIKTSQSEVKFIGSVSPLLSKTNTTSEFTHKRSDFSTFAVKEDLNITIQLKSLKLFLNFVENTNKSSTLPKYVFEGMGLPAHFIYNATLYRGHFVSQSLSQYIPSDLDGEPFLAIAMGPNESFIADENTIHDDIDENFGNDPANQYLGLDDDEDDDEDGYNDNQSDVESEFLDGNLEGLNATAANNTSYNHQNNSVYGMESIRSEMSEISYDPAKARQVLDLEHCDPEEFENVEIHYSSDSSDD